MEASVYCRNRSSSLANFIIVPIFLLVGLGLCAGGGYWGWLTRDFVQNAAIAPGTVVELTRHSDSDGVSYSPVVEYTLPSGRTVRFEEDVSSSPPSHHVGESVEVFYNPENPSEARINNTFTLWFGPGLLVSIGFCFSSISLLIGVGALFAFLRGR